MAAMQLLVRGDVQRVGYRAWCRRTARELGLSGFVRNLDDGRVEVFAEGDPGALDALAGACRTGPPHARVDDVARAPREPRGLSGFLHADDAAAPDAR